MLLLKVLGIWTAVSVITGLFVAPALARRLRDVNFPTGTNDLRPGPPRDNAMCPGDHDDGVRSTKKPPQGLFRTRDE
jgi:hypothetical protein